jgi:hypothetical protein
MNANETTDLRWCDKCNMETCWLNCAISIRPLISEWRCDRCSRNKERVKNERKRNINSK